MKRFIRKKLKEPDYFSTWLMRILINTALDFIKKNKRITPSEKLDRFGNSLYLKKFLSALYYLSLERFFINE
jgi:DNA-directed RNA polymerase specialized sigma24 family protein